MRMTAKEARERVLTNQQELKVIEDSDHWNDIMAVLEDAIFICKMYTTFPRASSLGSIEKVVLTPKDEEKLKAMGYIIEDVPAFLGLGPSKKKVSW